MPRSRTRLLSALLTPALITAATSAQSTEKPDLTKQPTLYAVGYAHLDTEWRWEYPQVIDRVKQYVAQGRWFPAGSSMEEGDVNAPDAEAVIRQILYGNEWFRRT